MTNAHLFILLGVATILLAAAPEVTHPGNRLMRLAAGVLGLVVVLAVFLR